MGNTLRKIAAAETEAPTQGPDAGPRMQSPGLGPEYGPANTPPAVPRIVTMWHPKTNKFEKRLHKRLLEVDAALEQRYGGDYPLHPSRPEHGTTAGGNQSGLFRVNTHFTPGYGSELGRGYIIDVEMVTLADVPDDVENHIEAEAAKLLETKLREEFPERDLRVERDGPLFKILGDFSLGEA